MLPFLAVRTGITVAELHTMSAAAVMSFFGEHAVQFMAEILDDPARAEGMTVAETIAWPAIKEAAALVGISGR